MKRVAHAKANRNAPPCLMARAPRHPREQARRDDSMRQRGAMIQEPCGNAQIHIRKFDADRRAKEQSDER